MRGKETEYLITTPLFYSSGEPHIGHAYTLTLANLIKKYFQLVGKKTYLLTGVDEHGEKILTKAKEEGKEPQKFVEEKSKSFQKLIATLEIESDYFIRTTAEKHKAFVANLFRELLQAEEIYHSNWEGYKCINCEGNYSKKYFAKTQVCELGHNLLLRSEKSYFLKVKKFREWLWEHYSQNTIILPKHYLNNLKEGYLKEIEDLSITREGLNWGIQIDSAPNTCIYVWFDALCGYISNLEVLRLWENKHTKVIQIIGKEIFRFHSLYFPLLLRFKNLPLTSKLIVHGWLLNEKNRKISKSELESSELSKSIPLLLQHFNLESIRWFCVFFNWEKDHLFSESLLTEYYNKYLVNLFGNLINRLKGILKKSNLVTGKMDKEKKFKTPEFIRGWELGDKLLDELEEKIENCEINYIIQKTIKLLEEANYLLEKFQPWKLESDSTEYQELSIFLLRQLTLSAFIFSPVFSEECLAKIGEALSIKTLLKGRIDRDYLGSIENFEVIKLSQPTNLFSKYL